MSIARRVALNTAVQFVGKILATFLGVVTVALLQRALKPEGYGAYTIILSYLGFFSVVADFGLYVILIRELNKPQTDRERVFANTLGIRLFTFGLVFLVALSVLPLFRYGPAVNQGVAIGVVGFLAVAVSQLTISLFQSTLTMRRVVVAELTGRLTLLAIIIVAINRGLGLSAMVAGVVLGNIIQLAMLLGGARRFIRLRVAFDWPYWRYLLTETAPVAASVVLNLIYFRLDTIILSLFRPAGEVGLYGASYKILEILNTFPIMFVGLMLPLLTQAAASDQDRFRRLYQQAFDALVIGVVPLLVGGWLLATPLLVLIGQQEFAAAAPILRLLLIAVGFLFLNSLSGHTVTVLHQQRRMVWGYLAVAVIGVALYLTLIPSLGMRGAAIGTIVTEASTALIGAIVVFRTARFVVSLGAFGKALIASGLMGLVLWLIPGQRLVLELPLGVVVYGLTIIAVRAVPLTFLRDLLRREVPVTPAPGL